MLIDNRKNSVFEGLVVTYVGKILGQIIGLVVSIILARILMPDDYGIIAVVMIFLNIADVFITDGFGNAVIQKKEVSNTDYSTVRNFSVVFSLLMYIGLFFTAPAISNFFSMPILTSVLRVLGLKLPMDAINSVQMAYVSRNMLFHIQLVASFVASIVSAGIGIAMAVEGFGVWALVGQNMINSIGLIIIQHFLIKQRFGFKFSYPIFKELFSFGWKLLVTQLIDKTFNEVRGLAIGKMFTRADLAFYQKGQTYPNMLMSNIDSSMSRVIFPVISRSQEDFSEVRRLVSKSVQLSCYVVIPFLVLFYAIADKLVLILLTEKWMPCVPFIRIFCVYYALTPIKSAKYQSIKAIGRSDVSLWCEIAQKIFGAIILLYTIFVLRTVEAIAYGNWAFAIVTVFITAIVCKKYIYLSYIIQIKDVLHSLIIGVIIIIPIYVISLMNFGIYLELVLEIVFALCTFVIGSKVLKFDEYKQIKKTILDFYKKIRYHK